MFIKKLIKSNKLLYYPAKFSWDIFYFFVHFLYSVFYKNKYYNSLKTSSNSREILVDITHVYKNDLKTGIQRVVRSVVSELSEMSLKEFSLRTVYLENMGKHWVYKYVDSDQIVVPYAGSVFLGLDLNSNIIQAKYFGLFDDWKKRGVQISFVVYDLLPIQCKSWFPLGTAEVHEKWVLAVLSVSDTVIAISNSVKEDVKIFAFQSVHKKIKKDQKLFYFHLGADIRSSNPTLGLPNNAASILSLIKERNSFLMVGTLEPRKGHLQVLKAFDELWRLGVDVNLVIVGKVGWMVEELITTLLSHSLLHNQLFWLDSTSDEYLEKIYASSACLIAASEGEGFGLPLIEAAQHRLPIIARDIPVFREVAGEFAYYFSNDNDPLVLVKTIAEWLELYKSDNHPKSDNMPWLTWEESAKQLCEILELS